MSLGDQLSVLKRNWLLIAIFALLFLVLASFMALSSGLFYSTSSDSLAASFDGGVRGVGSGISGLAEGVSERIVLRSSSLRLEVDKFEDVEESVRSLITEYDVIKTEENIRSINRGRYVSARFTLNVPSDNYEEFIEKAKVLGTIISFSETSSDVTGSYLTNQDILDLEREILESYRELYNRQSNVNSQVDLLRVINDQRSKIRSIENRIASTDERLDFTRVSLNLDERTPRHANVQFASFADLWSAVKASTNVMIWLLAYSIPFIILIGVFIYIKRLIRRE